MNELPKSAGNSETLDFDEIYRSLPEHLKRIVTVEDLRRYAEEAPLAMSQQNCSNEIERIIEEYDAKRKAG